MHEHMLLPLTRGKKRNGDTMKRLILVTILLFVLVGCGESLKGVESDYVIKVSGTEQQSFSGHYTIAGTTGIPKPVQASGKAPMEYQGKGFAAACVFRKTTAEGKLKVEILKGKDVVATTETAEPFGIITLGKIPDKNSMLNQILEKRSDRKSLTFAFST